MFRPVAVQDFTVDKNCSYCGIEQAEQEPDRCRLSRAIGTQKAADGASGYLQVKCIYNHA